MTDGREGHEAAFARLRRRLLVLAFVDEFGPLYVVYTLWFDDHGITTAQLSHAFILWALAVVLLEIPSGALADRVDRRLVLAGAFALRVAGIVTWVVWPSYGGLMIGALLWATHDASASGSWEALIYDEMAALGREEQYTSVIARIDQTTFVGTAVSAGLATGLLAVGVTLAQLGWITAAAAALAVPMVLWLPTAAHQPDDDGEGGLAGWWRTLRRGVAAARRDPMVRRLLILGALIEGSFVFDEYAPLLGRLRGADDALVAVLVGAIWVALFVGAEIAARRPNGRAPVLGSSLALAGGLLVAAMLTPWLVGVLALALAYLVLQTNWVIAEARMQAVLDSSTRATVSSARGFVAALVSATIFVEVGQLSVGDGDDPSRGLAWAAGLIVVAGLLVIVWLPRGRRQRQLAEPPSQPAEISEPDTG